jgi:hypothetical protein
MDIKKEYLNIENDYKIFYNGEAGRRGGVEERA